MTTRTILITGAGRGLGLGLAQLYAEKGQRVIGTVRDLSRSGELVDVAEQVIELDVGSDESIERCARAMTGLGALDVLINNAGINTKALRNPDEERDRGADGPGRGRGPLDLSREELMGVFDVNTFGPLLLTRAVRPALVQAGDPLVVNISSQLGSMAIGTGAASDAAYNSSKAALNMLTTNLAAALAPDGIAVICLHPGWVRTDMGGEHAALTVEQSAKAVVETIDGLSFTDSGHFFRWDGTAHPW